jgi:hypothetical protein
MTRPPPSRDDLLAFLADPDALPEGQREALEAALDEAVQGAVDALPPTEPSAGFDRDLFRRLDAADAEAAGTPWARLRAWWTAPRLGLALAAAVAVLLAVGRVAPQDAPGGPGPALLAQAESLELAQDLELYENLDVVEVMDVLDDLEVIESLGDEG